MCNKKNEKVFQGKTLFSFWDHPSYPLSDSWKNSHRASFLLEDIGERISLLSLEGPTDSSNVWFLGLMKSIGIGRSPLSNDNKPLNSDTRSFIPASSSSNFFVFVFQKIKGSLEFYSFFILFFISLFLLGL